MHVRSIRKFCRCKQTIKTYKEKTNEMLIKNLSGQFHMRGVKIQIFENRMHMKLYPVPHCEQVKVGRKINFSSLMTTMYLGGGPQSKNLFFFLQQTAGKK